MKKVSIITSCFNREETIRQTIESVLAQDYPNIEYIIIDGASNDNTLRIIQEYKSQITTLVSEKDNGIYEGINKGIKRATGDIIGLLHSDDFYCSNHIISDIVNYFEKTQADLIYGNGLFVSSHNPNKIVRNWISGYFNQNKIKYGWLPLHTTVYINNSCLKKYGLYDETFKISADSDFLVRYLNTAPIKIAYLNKYILKMRMGGASTSLYKSKQKWIEDICLYKKNGFNPYLALIGKILSKIPQYLNIFSIKKNQ